MKVSELSNADKDAILKKFRQQSLYQNLLNKQRKLASRGLMARVQEMEQYIRQSEQMFLEEYCKQYSEKMAGAKELSQLMAPEDFVKMEKQWHTVGLLVDMLNSRLFDMEEVLNKYKDQFTFVGYLDLKKTGYQLSQMVEQSMSTRSEKVDQLYADTICSIEDYLAKRVDTLIKRVAKIDEQYKRKVEKEHKALPNG